MNHIINYIKDILEDDDINVEIKDGKYIITKTYDAKYSGARETLFSMIKFSDKLKTISKLKTYLSETTFSYYVEIINPPKPVIRAKKPSDFYGELYGGLDMANSADSYVTIHRGSSFDNLGITIPGQVHNWDYGCYTI
jgi:hypothetical protein